MGEWNHIYPNIEVLRDLAIVLDVSVDEILADSEKMLKVYHTAKQALILHIQIQ